MNLFGMITTKVSWEYTSYALKSFFRKTKLGHLDKMVLIDNDGSFEEEASWFSPKLEIMKNRAPNSTGANFNQLKEIAAAADADLIFLHNDVVFTDGWQEPLFTAADAIISAVSNQYYQYEVKGVSWGATLKLNAYLGKETALREMVKLHKEHGGTLRPTLSAPFFCVRIPQSVYSALGDLDESLEPGSSQEADYCLRAYSQGLKVFLAEQSYVLHFSDASAAPKGGSGSESEISEQSARAAFEERWGRNLSRLVVDGDYSMLESSPELAKLHENHEYQSLIEKLKS